MDSDRALLRQRQDLYSAAVPRHTSHAASLLGRRSRALAAFRPEPGIKRPRLELALVLLHHVVKTVRLPGCIARLLRRRFRRNREDRSQYGPGSSCFGATNSTSRARKSPIQRENAELAMAAVSPGDQHVSVLVAQDEHLVRLERVKYALMDEVAHVVFDRPRIVLIPATLTLSASSGPCRAGCELWARALVCVLLVQANNVVQEDFLAVFFGLVVETQIDGQALVVVESP